MIMYVEGLIERSRRRVLLSMLFLAQEVVQVVSSCYRDARGNNRIMIR